jgi:hypothetical protein
MTAHANKNVDKYLVSQIYSDRCDFQGPQIAKVMPGVWMLTNKVRPSGEKQVPANSLSFTNRTLYQSQIEHLLFCYKELPKETSTKY